MNTVSSRAILLTALIMVAAGCDPSSPPPTPPVSTAPKSTAPSPSPSTPPPPLNLDRCPPQLREKQYWAPAGYDTGPLRPHVHVIATGAFPDRGGYRYKLPWTSYIEDDYELEVTVRRLDAPGTGEGSTYLTTGVGAKPRPGEHFFAGGIWVSAAGCWEVTGTLGSVSISFLLKAP